MSRDPVVPLAPGVWRIPLLGDFVNGFIFRDNDGQVTLMDMGVKASGPKVMAGLAAIGSSPTDVTRLLLSHATRTTRAVRRTSRVRRARRSGFTPRMRHTPAKARRRRGTSRSGWGASSTGS